MPFSAPLSSRTIEPVRNDQQYALQHASGCSLQFRLLNKLPLTPSSSDNGRKIIIGVHLPGSSPGKLAERRRHPLFGSSSANRCCAIFQTAARRLIQHRSRFFINVSVGRRIWYLVPYLSDARSRIIRARSFQQNVHETAVEVRCVTAATVAPKPQIHQSADERRHRSPPSGTCLVSISNACREKGRLNIIA